MFSLSVQGNGFAALMTPMRQLQSLHAPNLV